MTKLETKHFHMNGVSTHHQCLNQALISKQGLSRINIINLIFLTALILKVAGKVSQPRGLPPSPSATTYLIDTMACIQRYRKMKAKTFKEQAEKYIQKMVQSTVQRKRSRKHYN